MTETAFERVNAAQALKSRGDFSNWSSVKDRLTPEAWPSLSPSFKVPSKAKVFTIGSCFARNIEEHLALLGFQLPTLEFSVPEEEWSGKRRNGILNKYTPATVCQEIEWAAAIYERGTGFIPQDADPMRFDTRDGKVIDLHLGGFLPVTEERFIARRHSIYKLYVEAFSSDLVALTFGLTESWVDRDSGLHIHQAPATRAMLRDAKNYDFVNLDYEACLDYMKRSIETLRRLNPDVMIITTVSPVSLNATFTEVDVIIANNLSKSTLRSAVGKIERLYNRLDYFPSYENATLSPLENAYEADLRHVRDGFVGKIVKQLIAHYFEVTDTVSNLVQSAAVALGSNLKAEETNAFITLCDSVTQFETLSDDQLNIYLRSLWRLNQKKAIRAVAKEIMARETRLHRHLRAIAHIFPRCGLEHELRTYAKDILAGDPNNPIALKWVA
ncbi:GSCFA domain-containing protein [Celeribacter naphthalenivorans]|uniref:GSCFA domain-containing protein n=1 Tax=Celeribacter naphthalenivorans TaxID=1614694 RepID=UPI001CFA5AB5|nr:GSCFA domain-containing protein [Celeribacter naphthalenivorans]